MLEESLKLLNQIENYTKLLTGDRILNNVLDMIYKKCEEIKLLENEKMREELNKLIDEFVNKHKKIKLTPLTEQEIIIISLMETILEIRKSFDKNFPLELIKICKEIEKK